MKEPEGRPETAQEQREGISRRSLLVGTAGIAAASITLAPGAAEAQHAHQSVTGTRRGSSRIYDIQTFDGLTDIAQDPTAIPPPITRTGPERVRVDLETVEVEARLDANATFNFWTFNGRVPGPFVRVRVGDHVEVHLKNNENSMMMHNVDFHAATGPGGGAEATSAAPGEEKFFTFKALNPGIYVYHCAVPPVAQHIANGMYGLILVEPEGGLPPVDREFYVMQGEIYTEETFGTPGLLTESYDKMLNETPEYFVFNGHVAALTEHYPLMAKVGETVRLFFGVGGPNFGSSFHVIGEIFDRAYQLGSVTSEPIRDVQSIFVPPGSANIVEFKCEVPGRFVLVDTRFPARNAGWRGTWSSRETKTRIFSTPRPMKTPPVDTKEPAMIKAALLAVAATAVLVALATPALAHITLATTEAEAGVTFRAILVVGHGCDGEATTSVRVQIPEGFYNVKPMPKAGWEIQSVTAPYAKPFMNHGTELTEGVTEITWSGGALPDSQFDEFTFRGTFGSDLAAESTFYFPVIQYCGEKESPWIDTSGDEDAEAPAPGVVMKASSGEHHH